MFVLKKKCVTLHCALPKEYLWGVAVRFSKLIAKEFY